MLYLSNANLLIPKPSRAIGCYFCSLHQPSCRKYPSVCMLLLPGTQECLCIVHLPLLSHYQSQWRRCTSLQCGGLAPMKLRCEEPADLFCHTIRNCFLFTVSTQRPSLHSALQRPAPQAATEQGWGTQLYQILISCGHQNLRFLINRQSWRSVMKVAGEQFMPASSAALLSSPCLFGKDT